MYILLTALLLTASGGVGICLRYAPFYTVVTQKKRRVLVGIYLAASAVNTLIIGACMRAWGINAAFNYLRYGAIIYALLLTLVNMLVIKGKMREHMFVFGIALTCNHLLMSVPNFVVSMLEEFTPVQLLLIVVGLHLGLLLLTYLPLKKLLQSTVGPFMLMDTEKYWNTIWFLPILYFCAKYISLGGEHDTGSLTQLISSMLTGAIVIFMCMSIAADHVRLQERQAMERQLTDQKIHYRQLQTRVEESRKTRHDLKHHIAAIRRFAQLDDKEGVYSYCDELLDRVQGHEQIPYTGNTAADGVLYHYMQKSAQDNIDLQCVGTIHSPGIADIDLCILLGNALDNAVAGCLTLAQDRRIRVICQSEEKLLSVVIRNTFDGRVEQGREGLLSRKRENACGVGMRSMEDVCRRYGGSFEAKWEGNTFTVMFLLPLSE